MVVIRHNSSLFVLWTLQLRYRCRVFLAGHLLLYFVSLVESVEYLGEFVGLEVFKHLFLFLHENFVLVKGGFVSVHDLIVVLRTITLSFVGSEVSLLIVPAGGVTGGVYWCVLVPVLGALPSGLLVRILGVVGQELGGNGLLGLVQEVLGGGRLRGGV